MPAKTMHMMKPKRPLLLVSILCLSIPLVAQTIPSRAADFVGTQPVNISFCDVRSQGVEREICVRNPLIATLIHVVSELTFILNSTRLIPPREKAKPAGIEPVAAGA